MEESAVYETFFSFVNATCYLRLKKCPVVWIYVSLPTEFYNWLTLELVLNCRRDWKKSRRQDGSYEQIVGSMSPPVTP
jgi:hypothetical protein